MARTSDYEIARITEVKDRFEGPFFGLWNLVGIVISSGYHGSAWEGGNVIHTAIAKGPVTEVYGGGGSNASITHSLSGNIVEHEWTWAGGGYRAITEFPADLTNNGGLGFTIYCNGQYRLHQVSEAKFFGENVPWPEISYSNNYVPGEYYWPCDGSTGPCCGDELIGSISISIGPGFADCQFTNAKDTSCNERGWGYVEAQVTLIGPLSFTPDIDVINLDNEPVSGLECYIYAGDVFINSPPSELDLSKFIYKRSIPCKGETITIPIQKVLEDVAISYTVDLSFFETIVDTVAGYQYIEPVVSKLNNLQVKLTPASLGQPTLPGYWYDYHQISFNDLQGPMHYFHPSAGVTNKVAGEIKIIPEKDIVLGVWTYNPGGTGLSTEVELLEAGDNPERFTNTLNPQNQTIHPYRWLRMEYDSDKDIQAEFDLRWGYQSGLNFISGSRSYTLDLKQGQSNVIDIDLLNYSKINGAVRGELPEQQPLLSPVIFDSKEFDSDNSSYPHLVPSQTYPNAGVGGTTIWYPRIAQPTNRIDSLRLIFADASVKVHSLKAFVKDEAKLWWIKKPYALIDGCYRYNQDEENHILIKNWLNYYEAGYGVQVLANSIAASGPYEYWSVFDDDKLLYEPIDLIQGGIIYGTGHGMSCKVYNGIGGDEQDCFQGSFPLYCRQVWGNKLVTTQVPRGTDEKVIAILGSEEFTTTTTTPYGWSEININKSNPTLGTVKTYLENHLPIDGYATSEFNLNGRFGEVFWTGFGLFGIGNQPSTDRAGDQLIFTGVLDHGYIKLLIGGYENYKQGNWRERGTDIPAEYFCLRVDTFSIQQILVLVTSYANRIELRTSEDGGLSWSMATYLGIGQSPGLVVLPDGRRYIYWVDETTVYCSVYDAQENVLIDPQIVYEGVDRNTGIAVEYAPAKQVDSFVMLVIVDNEIRRLSSEDGLTF